MTAQREALRAKLLAQAEQAIDELLKGLPDERPLTLRDMEDAAGDLEAALGQATVQTLLEVAPGEPGPVACPDCGRRMQRRGQRKKRLVTVRGEVELERPYYRCPACGVTHFPPG